MFMDLNLFNSFCLWYFSEIIYFFKPQAIHNAIARASNHLHNRNLHANEDFTKSRKSNPQFIIGRRIYSFIIIYSFKLKTIQWRSTEFSGSPVYGNGNHELLFVCLFLLFLLFYLMKVASCVLFVIKVLYYMYSTMKKSSEPPNKSFIVLATTIMTSKDQKSHNGYY